MSSKASVEIQKNTHSVVQGFIEFYYKAWNEKDFSSLISMYEKWSEILFNGSKYVGQDQIAQLFTAMSQQNPIFEITNIDFLLCGARRANILVTGKIKVGDTITVFTEYIHLGTKKSGYWIQSSIFRGL